MPFSPYCRISALEFTQLLLAPCVLCVLAWGLSQGADANEMGEMPLDTALAWVSTHTGM